MILLSNIRIIFIPRDEMDWNGLSRNEILEWDWHRFSLHILCSYVVRIYVECWMVKRKKIDMASIIFDVYIYFYPLNGILDWLCSMLLVNFHKTILHFNLFILIYLLNINIHSLYDNGLCFLTISNYQSHVN